MILSEQEKNRIRGLHKKNSVIKESNHGAMTWTCEQQPNSTPPCHCVPTPNWGGPGPGAYATQAECMTDTSNCCGNSYGHYECVNGQCTPQVGGQYNTLQDCQIQCGGGTQEWACMGGPNANGCQSGPVGSFQIGQGGVMGIYSDQTTCVGSCTSGFGWECNPSGAAGCVQTAAGPYNSMSQCQAACGSYGNDKYDCVNNSCTAISPTDPGYNSAPFLTIDDCEDSMCGDRRAPIQPRGPKADMPGGALSESDRIKLLSRYDTRTTLNEQKNVGHDDLMDGIDKMCIDKPWDNEKMVGNRSCRRCHSDLIDLIKDYCGSFPSEEETYLDDPGQIGVPSIKHQIAQKG